MASASQRAIARSQASRVFSISLPISARAADTLKGMRVTVTAGGAVDVSGATFARTKTLAIPAMTGDALRDYLAITPDARARITHRADHVVRPPVIPEIGETHVAEDHGHLRESPGQFRQLKRLGGDERAGMGVDHAVIPPAASWPWSRKGSTMA